MANGFYRRTEGGRPRIRIYVNRFDGEPTFETVTCQPYVDGKQQQVPGCGQTVYKFKTYPGTKSMRFDAMPEEVPDTRERVDGPIAGMVAWVYSENNHFATCPVRNSPAAQADAQTQAAGGVR